MSTELENRLTQALNARADQVGPADLSARFAPRAAPPRWTRSRTAYVGGGVLVAAAAAVIAVAVIGNGGDDRPAAPAQTGVASDTPTPQVTTPPPVDPSGDPSAPGTGQPEPEVPAGLLPRDEPVWSRDGETYDYDDGFSATVTGTTIEITRDGVSSTATLPVDAEGGVAPFQLPLGQSGSGYLVLQSGGEFASYSVVVLRDGQAVVATEPDDVSLDSAYDEATGAIVETWTTGEGSALFTRVALDEPGSPDNAYQVYRWEVTGPGEGGPSAPPDPDVSLVHTDLGVVCFEPDGSDYGPC